MAKAKLIPVIDHSRKLVAGHTLGESADTALALHAWEKALSTLKRLA